MLKTFEAILGLIIVYGAFLAFSRVDYNQSNSLELVRENLQQSALDLRQLPEFRAKVLAVNSDAKAAELKSYLSGSIDYSYEVEVCTLGNTCYGTKPAIKNVATVNFLVDGNSTELTARKVRLYGWIIRGVEQ